MLKRIIYPSAFLVTFITLLHLNLSKPQRKHLLRIADAIVVCEGRKTLANLYRQELYQSACREAIQMGSIEPVLQRFIAAPVFT